MRRDAWLKLVVQNLRRSRREFVLSIFGIALGIAALSFFIALAAGVRETVLGRVFHIDRIEIEPAKASFDLPLFGSGPRPIGDDVVRELAALPGVRSVAPRMRLAFPAKAWGGAQLFGTNRFAEVLGEGLDPAAVASERFGPEPFADLESGPHEVCNADGDCKQPGEYCAWDVHQCQRPVPVIISRVLLELYNSGFAPAHGLPRVGDLLASRFRGFTFTVELGASFLGASAARSVSRQRRVMLVGISDRAMPVGVSFPLPYVQRWNAEYAGTLAAAGYSSVTVEVADKGAITGIAAAARALGLAIVDTGAERAGVAITLIGLLFVLVSLAILAVAALNIAHTFFRAVAERRREIGVMRAVGASRRDIHRLLLGEAAAIGAVGGALGLAAAFAAARLADWAAARFVPEFPFKPDTFFHFSPITSGAIWGFAVLTCLMGALLPAAAAARVDPSAALASR